VASPESKPWWVLWICVCMWLVYAPKMFYLCINQLVVWFVQVHVSIDLLVNLPSPHLRALARLSTPKCYKLGSAIQLFFLSLSSFGLVVNPLRSLGVRENVSFWTSSPRGPWYPSLKMCWPCLNRFCHFHF
jgi:hypothetical protein